MTIHHGPRKKGKRHTRKTCMGKTRFRDKQEADRALRIAHNRNERDRKPVRAYECPDCRGWHLTSRRAWR